MYDSLNRHFLPNYGCRESLMPNFERLGERTVTFDNSYVGSLPCMPARRELHTGRLNFLHRGWCPLEPFDDSAPEIMKQNGIYTHIVSDHQHYWEDGGATYHTRYSSWECNRGQEGDPWKGSLEPQEEHKSSFGPRPTGGIGANMRRQDSINRKFIQKEEDFPQARTFAQGLEFIERNREYDNWFLQIETFDPHEPFYSPEEFQEIYQNLGEEPGQLDWPPYGPVTESEDTVRKVRVKYRALLSMCDKYLGKVLDMMDKYDMWKDTMLIVNTDHGFMLGEHLWWAKGVMPLYNEMANTPLFIWDPRCKKSGERRKSLVQTIDLAPTLLEYFNIPIPKDMQGKPLKNTIAYDKKIHDYVLFGIFGSMINITDGKFLYMRAPHWKEDDPLTEYTLMPTVMRARLPVERLQNVTLHAPFSFTKGCPVLAIPASEEWGGVAACYRYGDVLYDLQKDPQEEEPVWNPKKEVELINAMAAMMKENDAPEEQFIRMGIPKDEPMTLELLSEQKRLRDKYNPLPGLKSVIWKDNTQWEFAALENIASFIMNSQELECHFSEYLKQKKTNCVYNKEIQEFMKMIIPEEEWEGALFTMEMAARLR